MLLEDFERNTKFPRIFYIPWKIGYPVLRSGTYNIYLYICPREFLNNTSSAVFTLAVTPTPALYGTVH